jgi:hypothetical protein
MKTVPNAQPPSTTATVTNVDPVVLTLAATSVLENGVVHLTGTYSDVGSQDTHQLTINWGEGAPQVVSVSGGSFAPSVETPLPRLRRCCGLFPVLRNCRTLSLEFFLSAVMLPSRQ